MDLSSLRGYEQAEKAMRQHMTPRAQHLAELERWVDGTQYDGRPSFWDEDVALQDKAPALVYGVMHAALDSNRSLTMGEGRFPAVTARPGEDDAEFDDAIGLDEAASDAVDYLLDKVFTQVRFRRACRDMFEHGMSVGTSVALLGARNGRLFIDTLKARWCTPTFDDDRGVTRLAIQYPYLEPVQDEDGQWRVVAKLYRREIDAFGDTTHAAVEIRPGEREVPRGAKKTILHGLGFCPVVWYPFMAGVSIEGQIDGRALHWQKSVRDMLEAHDFAVSQRHRAALFVGDPQIAEFGVEKGSSPTDTVRRARVPATRHGGMPSADNPVVGRGDPKQGYIDVSGTGPQRGRKKSPGTVWQYENPESRVELLSLAAGALEPLDANARDIRDKIAERLQVTFLDPEHVRGISSVSGRALLVLKERQLDACSEYREDTCEQLILPLADMLLRICHVLGPSALRIGGLKKVHPILARFAEGGVWRGPPLTLKWGAFASPDAEEEAATVDTATKAHDAGIITIRTAVEKCARTFGIDNVGAYMESLEEEAEEKQKQALALAHAAGPENEDEKNEGAEPPEA